MNFIGNQSLRNSPTKDFLNKLVDPSIGLRNLIKKDYNTIECRAIIDLKNNQVILHPMQKF